MQMTVGEQEQAFKLQNFEINAQKLIIQRCLDSQSRRMESKFDVYEAFYEYDVVALVSDNELLRRGLRGSICDTRYR